MRALVTGADGFVGRHLLRHLTASGDAVRAAAGAHFAGDDIDGITATAVDIRDADALIALARDAAPDVIYHLAAVSGAGDREQADAAINVNVIGSLNVLRACAALEAQARLILVSSAMVYGSAAPGEALSEEHVLAPSNVYGASKLAAEKACAALAVHLGIDLVVARPFNHTGPGQTTNYAVPAFAVKIAAVRRGETDCIPTGSLEAIRDLSDVRDVVRAYRLLATAAPDAYNIASGRGIGMGALLERMLVLAGVDARIDAPASNAGSDPSILIGDALHLARRTGWQPTIDLDTTLRDVLAEHDAIA